MAAFTLFSRGCLVGPVSVLLLVRESIFDASCVKEYTVRRWWQLKRLGTRYRNYSVRSRTDTTICCRSSTAQKTLHWPLQCVFPVTRRRWGSFRQSRTPLALTVLAPRWSFLFQTRDDWFLNLVTGQSYSTFGKVSSRMGEVFEGD